ncbi:MAG: ethanolamine permease [Myxococcales bacterium]|nr:MAG: ethanolamine permease [Myxococcales bacterium]
MPDPKPTGKGVRYEEVHEAYFEARGLRRHAGVWSLWALGVGAVISGDFFGWNFGLGFGGFGGMIFATAIVAVMYAGLCYSIAEMTAALPHTGGAYSFARTALGPWGGYVTGLAENMEYVLTPAVIVVGIGGYLGAIFETPESLEPLWWFLSYALFVIINIIGVELAFKMTVVITFAALAVLLVFFVGALPHVDIARYGFGVTQAQSITWLPHGVSGILRALPFAIWFFLAIEQLPLAAEEAHAPQRDLPKGLTWGFLTLTVCAFGTLFFNSVIPPGAQVIASSEEPLFDGFRTIFGSGLASKLLAAVALTGLLASFHAIIYAGGRQIYSLSRAGYFPRFLSLTHKKRKTPHVALFVGSVLGFAVTLAVRWLGKEQMVGAVLLSMAVFGAMIAYLLQMISFIVLRLRFESIERPYRSPFGIAGAMTASIIALVTLIALFIGEAMFVQAVIGAALWYACGLAYFALHARHRLVYSPEEAFAEKHLKQLL